jgi:hypothetical protein
MNQTSIDGIKTQRCRGFNQPVGAQMKRWWSGWQNTSEFQKALERKSSKSASARHALEAPFCLANQATGISCGMAESNAVEKFVEDRARPLADRIWVLL